MLARARVELRENRRKARELQKLKRDQGVLPSIAVHPPPPDSTLSHPYNVTNTEISTVTLQLQDDIRFDSSPADNPHSLTAAQVIRPPTSHTLSPHPPPNSLFPSCETHKYIPTPPPDSESLTSDLDHPSLPPLPNSPSPEPEAVGAHRAPVGEPPAWRLDYIIGTGAYGTVFLENVHLRGMKSPELWAVKRIPQTLPNFTWKRYQAEIKNLQALARVSFSQT